MLRTNLLSTRMVRHRYFMLSPDVMSCNTYDAKHKILIDFCTCFDVPEVLDSIHCIGEHNCFYRGCLRERCVFCY